MDTYITALIALYKYTVRIHPISTLNLQSKQNGTIFSLLMLFLTWFFKVYTYNQILTWRNLKGRSPIELFIHVKK